MSTSEKAILIIDGSGSMTGVKNDKNETIFDVVKKAVKANASKFSNVFVVTQQHVVEVNWPTGNIDSELEGLNGGMPNDQSIRAIKSMIDIRGRQVVFIDDEDNAQSEYREQRSSGAIAGLYFAGAQFKVISVTDKPSVEAKNYALEEDFTLIVAEPNKTDVSKAIKQAFIKDNRPKSVIRADKDLAYDQHQQGLKITKKEQRVQSIEQQIKTLQEERTQKRKEIRSAKADFAKIAAARDALRVATTKSAPKFKAPAKKPKK